MKMEDVVPVALASSRTRGAATALPVGGVRQPADPEKESLISAIRSSTIYAGIVLTLNDAGEQREWLAALTEFVQGLESSVPFSAYCIITPEVAATGGDDEVTTSAETIVGRILFKAVGSSTAASLKELGALPASGNVEVYTDFVDVQRKLVARIKDYCEGAVCIAAVGPSGVIPLWIWPSGVSTAIPKE